MMEILDASGERLRGIMCNASSKKLLIICHGRMCTKEMFFYPGLSEKLSADLNVFRFDFSGNGESEGKFEECTLTKEIEDIRSVVEHFKSDYEIILLGHSLGAAAVMLYQAKYGGASAIIDVSGTINQTIQLKYSDEQKRQFEEIGHIEQSFQGKKFRVSNAYYQDRLAHGDISKEIAKIKVPALVLHGTEDKDTPTENGEIASKAIGGSILMMFNGADHFYEGFEDAMASTILRWLETI